MLNSEDLPISLQPSFKKMQKANTAEEALLEVTDFFKELRKLPQAEQDRVREILFNFPIALTKKQFKTS